MNSRVMSRRAFVALGGSVLTAMASGCSGQAGSSISQIESQRDSFVQKTSDDKHVQYVKNYVGMNLANVGARSSHGFIGDKYGDAIIKLALLAPNGEYIDPDDTDSKKGYWVVGQSPVGNTQIDVTYDKKSDGTEYDGLVYLTSYDEILLILAPSGETLNKMPSVTETKASSDQYTRYVRDYSGRNIASCGFISSSGEVADVYGVDYVKLEAQSKDGTYLDFTDPTTLDGCRVVSQNVSPNTAINVKLETSSTGVEYDNIVESSSVESIVLKVEKVKKNSS